MSKDTHDRPMAKHNDIDAGLKAFQDALRPQEGQFMRGATWIMNEPKTLKKAGGSLDPGESVAQKLLDRNAKGQFVAKDAE